MRNFLRSRKIAVCFIALFLVGVLSGCSSGKQDSGGGDSAREVDYPTKPFEFVAPAGPGGGWDTTIRMVAKVLGETGLVNQPMPVVNKPGGGGAVGLAYMQEKKGSPYHVVVYSPPLLLINLTGQTQLSYKNLTPLVILINDFGAFAVPKNSRFNSINEVMEALKKDPKSVKIGGASSPGSMDHMQFLQAAKAAGVNNLKDIQYISFQSGESLAALMGGHIDLLSTGMAEVVGPLESGDIKVLAITAPERVKEGPLSQVPTLKEQGIDAVFVNWRGLFGPPEMPDYTVKYLSDTLAKMVQTPEWKEIVKKNGWTEAFMGPEEFKAFLDRTNEEYKSLLVEVGLYKGQ
ncbi:tripartite tricarboxylate transporter substrate binding protein [Thermosediminibacter litoriperuensis]|uniref:Putative tricarboxylic transport membrane protein n=1 Tax=Thermosediminibacter litoriperuensis TaxID=291989 RepID=A0A5S5ATK6_9FIRM|nr:tripartite tricarboxylate transporter substrate binding protein [Thermosediminibacter litoriperuensis]TYP55416.1 putative tricarboxylic transport membrane protein [Thermosediminibacter litoriperuensis]